MTVISYLESFVGLLFPNVCMGCGGVLSKQEKVLCFICENNLPKTFFHNEVDNAVFKRLYGRIPIENATSLFYFDKGGTVQHLMHQLKYNDKKEVGSYLGKMLGNYLLESNSFNSIESVIPVPLHEKKLYQRGYNQSEYFADGIAEAMSISCLPNALKRTDYTETQTGKNRFERWDNVKDAFELINPELIKNKHVLLVDDVVTTGATLEACAHRLMDAQNTKVSIATIAYAQ